MAQASIADVPANCFDRLKIAATDLLAEDGRMKCTNDLVLLLLDEAVVEEAKKLGRLLGEADALKKEPYGTGIVIERIKGAERMSKLTPDLQVKVRETLDIAYEAGWKSVTGP
jgi:hypothetical protein